METIEQIRKPSKKEQKVALESYSQLAAIIGQISAAEAEIEIEAPPLSIKNPSPVLISTGSGMMEIFGCARMLKDIMITANR